MKTLSKNLLKKVVKNSENIKEGTDPSDVVDPVIVIRPKRRK